MSRCRIDHITVTSPSLDKGAEFVRQTLGVEPQPGGEHPRMGTHNLLLRLGDSLYLEVISPNSKVPRPERPRWFGLDSMPSLSAWVVRTTDIREAASLCNEPLGTIEPMRRGAFSWLISVPADGSVPLDGVGPALIEWHTGIHPAAALPDFGLSLVRLDLFHSDPARVSRLLFSIDLEGPCSVFPLAEGEVGPYLVALIKTPRGLRTVSCPNASRSRTLRD